MVGLVLFFLLLSLLPFPQPDTATRIIEHDPQAGDHSRAGPLQIRTVPPPFFPPPLPSSFFVARVAVEHHGQVRPLALGGAQDQEPAALQLIFCRRPTRGRDVLRVRGKVKCAPAAVPSPPPSFFFPFLRGRSPAGKHDGRPGQIGKSTRWALSLFPFFPSYPFPRSSVVMGTGSSTSPPPDEVVRPERFRLR